MRDRAKVAINYQWEEAYSFSNDMKIIDLG